MTGAWARPFAGRPARPARGREARGAVPCAVIALIWVLSGSVPAVHAATPGSPELTDPIHPDTLFVAAPGPRHRMARPDWDIGTGFVRVRPDPDGPPGAIPSVVIDVRAAPDAMAEVVARAHFEPWTLRVESYEAELTAGGLEVGYEEIALPVFEAHGDGDWVRASYGFAADGASRTGWIDVRAPTLEVFEWGNWLYEWGVAFFIDPERIEFHDAPGGEPIQVDLVPGGGSWRFDYTLHPHRTDGHWMQVEVVSPSDYCVVLDDDAIRPPTRAWIRHLDDDGRPLVWYFTRGC